eukprot:jgi/Mesen1/2852/ME000174S02100
MVMLEADPFLNELTKLYERNKTTGTVYVTFKRSNLRVKTKKGSKSEQAERGGDNEYGCLVRASDSKKKISTLITTKEHGRFQAAYATVLKAHMDALKKREKKDKKKAVKGLTPAP